jgi:hypothetical protein
LDKKIMDIWDYDNGQPEDMPIRLSGKIEEEEYYGEMDS